MTSLQARFHALMDACPDAVLVINGRTGIIKEVNSRALEMFGYSAESLIGHSMEVLVPESIRSIHSAYRLGFLSSVRRREMGYHPPIMSVQATGVTLKIAVGLTATTADDDVMVVCSDYARWEASHGAQKGLLKSHSYSLSRHMNNIGSQ
jgi:PAS domain S-box-containing protein